MAVRALGGPLVRGGTLKVEILVSCDSTRKGVRITHINQGFSHLMQDIIIDKNLINITAPNGFFNMGSGGLLMVQNVPVMVSHLAVTNNKVILMGRDAQCPISGKLS